MQTIGIGFVDAAHCLYATMRSLGEADLLWYLLPMSKAAD